MCILPTAFGGIKEPKATVYGKNDRKNVENLSLAY